MPLGFSRPVSLALGLILPLLVQADDAYLREIEDEAKRQATTLTTIQPPPRPALGPATAGPASERLASGLDRSAFDQALRAGSSKEQFAAFQRLTPRNQQQVYEFYRTDSRLATIGEQIARLGATKP